MKIAPSASLLFALVFTLISCATVETKHSELKNRQSPANPNLVKNQKGSNPLAGGKKIPPGTKVAGLDPATGGLSAVQISFSRAEEFQRQNLFLEALKTYVETTSLEPKSNLQESARLRAVDIVETKLNSEQLEQVSRNSDFGFARAYALFRLGQNSFDKREHRDARKYFSSVIDFLPGSDLAFRATEFVEQIDSLNRVQAKSIGVVLPLSGKNAALGQKTLRGIQMGLGLHLNNSNFKLAVIDSEGNPDTARRGVEKLVKEDNVIAIIGSLLSKEASVIASKTNELGVPSVGLSQKSGLTDIGPTIFRNSLTSEMQVRQLVRVSMAQGMKEFAILYPNDAYGVEYANIFWDEVLARGGKITAAQSYDSKETDFRYPIQRLAGSYYIESRMDEYKIRTKEYLENNKKNRGARENVNADDILPPIVDFDAIFIPDSAKTMGQLSAFLSYAGVKNVKLLGTNLWNTAGLGKRAGHFANNILFVDGFWSGSPQVQSSRFFQEYKSQFSEEPSLIETQAYDTALILRQLIVQGADTRPELLVKLAGFKNIPGALGPLSMSSNREVLRPMTTLTLDKAGEMTPVPVTVKE